MGDPLPHTLYVNFRPFECEQCKHYANEDYAPEWTCGGGGVGGGTMFNEVGGPHCGRNFKPRERRVEEGVWKKGISSNVLELVE